MCPKNRITSSDRIPLDLGTISSQDIPGFLGIYHNSYSNLCSREYMAIILLQAWSSMQFWDGIYIPLHCFQTPALCKLAAIRAQKEALQNLCQPTCAKGMIHTSCFTRNSAGPVISWCQSQTKTNRLSPAGSQGNKNDTFPKKKTSLQKSHDQQHLVGVGFHPMSRRSSNLKDSPRY